MRAVLDGKACWIEGNATPFGMYAKLYRHRDQFVVIDDVDALYADRSGVRLLKCLCQTDPREADLALVREPDLVTLVDARRDRDAHCALAFGAAVAVAGVARRLDDLALAAAPRTGADVDHLAEHRLADRADLAATLYWGQVIGSVPGLAPLPPHVSHAEDGELDLLLGAPDGLLERDAQVVAQVRAGAVVRAAPRPPPAPPPKNASKMSEKPPKPRSHPRRRRRRRRRRRPARTCRSAGGAPDRTGPGTPR